MADARPPFDPLLKKPAPPPDLALRVRSAVAKTPASRSTATRRIGFALVAIPVAIWGGLFGSQIIFHGRPLFRVDLWLLPEAELAERFVVLVLLAALATGIALIPGRRGLGARVVLLLIASLAVAPLYTLVTMVEPIGTPEGDAAARALHPLGLPCALVAFTVGMLALGAFGLALRRAVPAAPVNRAAALGAAAGGWAGVALFLQCPAKNTLHMLVGHSLPVALFALLGAIVLPRLLRP
ncbi:MAG TPA: NrsF family protein [Polyangiaceae bacterium]|nr:NrsF family protein [Polyangiaceae bacterium]